MHSNTKYWSFTWDTNVAQKKLPPVDKLERFLNSIAAEATFQLERGSKEGKEHYQGVFTLNGPRQSKSAVLASFTAALKVTAGLTLSKVYSAEAIQKYVTKEEGRISGPYYVGTKEKYDPEIASMELRPWQKDLYSIMTGELRTELTDRKVIIVENTVGGAGKSRFVKWLRAGQKKLVARKLPISSVDRLTSAICLTSKSTTVDLFTIDLPRTISENLSLTDLFQTLEDTKNGHLIDTMYGKYNEAIFEPPLIVIFTNKTIKELYPFMSKDRWVTFTIGATQQLVEQITDGEGNHIYQTPVVDCNKLTQLTQDNKKG